MVAFSWFFSLSLSLHMSAILGLAKHVPDACVAKLTYDYFHLLSMNHFSQHKATSLDKSGNKAQTKGLMQHHTEIVSAKSRNNVISTNYQTIYLIKTPYYFFSSIPALWYTFLFILLS
jgi:transposase-like protein